MNENSNKELRFRLLEIQCVTTLCFLSVSLRALLAVSLRALLAVSLRALLAVSLRALLAAQKIRVSPKRA